jgi:alpha-L-arabinofuranosidase
MDKNSSELIVKWVNASGKTQTKDFQVTGIKKMDTEAKVIMLKADDLSDVNSFSQPQKIAPVEQALKLKGKKISLSLLPYSITVIRVKVFSS